MPILAPRKKATIDQLNFVSDWPEVRRLMEAEDWPFVRADIEASHAQPRSVGLVARAQEDNTLHGFFVAHHFGDVGYFDMMIVDESVRRSKIATRLAFETDRALKQKGMRGFVGHSTNDSFDVFRFFGYQSGLDFTLMRREAKTRSRSEKGSNLDDITLSIEDAEAVIALDASVFGKPRPDWIRALYRQPSTRFVGIRSNGRLLASVCLRKRRGEAFCLDAVNATEFGHLESLLPKILAALPHQRVECFARTGCDLHRWLKEEGWQIPDFFQAIGPLVEWRKGRTGGFGDTLHIRSLNWF